MTTKTANQLARELQALQLLEDGNSLNGLHHKAIRRKLVSQLVEVTAPESCTLRSYGPQVEMPPEMAAQIRPSPQDAATREAAYRKWGKDARFYDWKLPADYGTCTPSDGKSLGDAYKDAVLYGTGLQKFWGIDPGEPGSDRTGFLVTSGRRAGKNSATAEAMGITQDKLRKFQKALHEMLRPKDAPSDGTLDAAVYIDRDTLEPFRVRATTQRHGGIPVYHDYARKEGETAGEFVGRMLDRVENVCGHAAAMALEGAICEAERAPKEVRAGEVKRCPECNDTACPGYEGAAAICAQWPLGREIGSGNERLKEQAQTSTPAAGFNLHQIGGNFRAALPPGGKVYVERYSDQRWAITVHCAGEKHTEQVFATADEPVEGTIGFMTGVISNKYGPAFGDEAMARARKLIEQGKREPVGAAGGSCSRCND